LVHRESSFSANQTIPAAPNVGLGTRGSVRRRSGFVQVGLWQGLLRDVAVLSARLEERLIVGSQPTGGLDWDFKLRVKTYSPRRNHAGWQREFVIGSMSFVGGRKFRDFNQSSGLTRIMD
jgi:hypothetical protein